MWHTSACVQWLRAYRCVGVDKPVAQIFGQVLDQVCRYAAPGNAKALGFLAHMYLLVPSGKRLTGARELLFAGDAHSSQLTQKQQVAHL